MELKQIEFFVAACENKSLSKAAEKLYTTQPNVSKVIKSLEDELGKHLFERTSKGLRLTDYGKSIYEYALDILKNASLITNTEFIKQENILRLSAYQSHVIARIIVKLYKECDNLKIEYFQGTVEEISSNVAQGVSEIGILYVSKKQLGAFRRIIAHKNLEFVELAKKKACIFVGHNNPLYKQNSISVEKLSELTFTRGLKDFFSIEHHLEEINVGLYASDTMRYAVYTNSEHLSTDMLLETDLAVLGIDVNDRNKEQENIKALWIEDEDSYLVLGYVYEKGRTLTNSAQKLIENFKEVI